MSVVNRVISRRHVPFRRAGRPRHHFLPAEETFHVSPQVVSPKGRPTIQVRVNSKVLTAFVDTGGVNFPIKYTGEDSLGCVSVPSVVEVAKERRATQTLRIAPVHVVQTEFIEPKSGQFVSAAVARGLPESRAILVEGTNPKFIVPRSISAVQGRRTSVWVVNPDAKQRKLTQGTCIGFAEQVGAEQLVDVSAEGNVTGKEPRVKEDTVTHPSSTGHAGRDFSPEAAEFSQPKFTDATTQVHSLAEIDADELAPRSCKVMEGLQLAPGQSFLNLGSGTGYLSTMAGLILGPYGINHGVELHADVVSYGQERLEHFKKNSSAIDAFTFCDPQFVQGNCLCLPPDMRLYDRVYCGASCPESHENYMKGLINEGGILVMPLNDQLVKITRKGPSSWDVESLLPVSFSSLVMPDSSHPPSTVNLPTAELMDLQEICRQELRSILRTNIEKEHPNLVTAANRPVQRQQRNRDRRQICRIVVPYAPPVPFYESDDDPRMMSDEELEDRDDRDTLTKVTRLLDADDPYPSGKDCKGHWKHRKEDDETKEGPDENEGSGSPPSPVESYSTLMREKISLLPLPQALKLYLNYHRELQSRQQLAGHQEGFDNLPPLPSGTLLVQHPLHLPLGHLHHLLRPVNQGSSQDFSAGPHLPLSSPYPSPTLLSLPLSLPALLSPPTNLPHSLFLHLTLPSSPSSTQTSSPLLSLSHYSLPSPPFLSFPSSYPTLTLPALRILLKLLKSKLPPLSVEDNTRDWKIENVNRAPIINPPLQSDEVVRDP
ncbi:hypothetical protein C7M84_006923 [Penaeus vannamei]|uniref:Protein-L-isoaspartate O-methyltransferase domain-containing protein 1 n=1 Tax=Penaeus vannamei TaxID=6689 RepID=A0A423TDN5_PENVA|nr:hypothetical protein C7M84_006923 [Penaeus vannamei]